MRPTFGTPRTGFRWTWTACALTIALIGSVGGRAHAQESAPAPARITKPSDTPIGDEKKSRFEPMGFDGSYMRLGSQRSRERFGDVYGFSPGIGSVERADTGGALEPDLDVLIAGGGEATAILIPIGIGYRVGFGTENATLLPYAGVTANIVPSWLGSREDGVAWKLRFDIGASAVVGVNIAAKLFVEVRYRAITKVGGFDMSGTTLGAGFRF